MNQSGLIYQHPGVELDNFMEHENIVRDSTKLDR